MRCAVLLLAWLAASASAVSVFDFEAQLADSTTVQLNEAPRFRSPVTLIVNTASQCGFTAHYAGLQALHERFEALGLRIWAFPCNQFGEQEPASNADIQQFTRDQYGVTFPVFAKAVLVVDAA